MTKSECGKTAQDAKERLLSVMVGIFFRADRCLRVEVGTSSKQTSYSKEGKTIRVDMLRRIVIIAVGGKIGNPLTIVDTAFGIRVA
jgi:hypothetical protein